MDREIAGMKPGAQSEGTAATTLQRMPLAQALALAEQHRGMGRLPEARSLCTSILAAQPNEAGAFHLLGLIAHQSGQLDEAIAHLRHAVSLTPEVPLFHANLAEIYRLAGRVDDAVREGRRAVELKPDYLEALSNLGVAYYEQNDYEEAARCYRRAIDCNPKFATAHGNLGNALRALARFDEAIASYRIALALDRNFAGCWSNLGLTLAQLGRHDEALDAYRTAVKADPLLANGHVGVALQTLLRGNLADGWFEYQWRWRSSELSPPRIAAPAWQGDAPAGRHILLVAEQGLGDTIQMCRYAAVLRDAGANVSLMVQRPLVRLLSANLPWATVVEDQPQHPACDVWCPFLTVPLLLGTTAETIPAGIPYLRAPAELATAWQIELGDRGRLRVGVVWAGSPKHVNDHNRSVPLATLAPLLAIDGITWVSLQTGPRASEVAGVPEPPFDPSARLGDFLDTAALVSQLDLVISVDTAVAHLAGAMGVPVWVLLPVGNDWRWQLNREDTRWYPTMRLFRQQAYGEWQPVVARVREALSGLANAGPDERRE
jgi:tetratricopeptide (TPR) repeat protein